MNVDRMHPHDGLKGADPRIAELLDAWRAARHGDLVARRSAFDPLTIARMLEYVWIYRVALERGDYVCDLAGEEVNAAWGCSIKGRTLTEIVGSANRDTLAQRWDDARDGPAILYSTTVHLPDPHVVHRVERLVLPMTGRTGQIDSMLGISLYDLRHDGLSADSDAGPVIPADVLRIPATDL